MRIALTGSHGVGKTTLGKALAGATKVRLMSEAPFLAYQTGLSLNENTGVEAELWIALKQLEQERTNRQFISDRCLIDTLAYTHLLYGEDKCLINIMHRLAQGIEERYDLVIYLPAGEFSIEDDGLRSTKKKFQRDADRYVRYILRHYNIPHVVITGNRKVRLQRAIRAYEEVKRRKELIP